MPQRAAQSQDERERQAWLTFFVVGGGPAGVEFTGALVELLRQVLGREYTELAPDSARILLVEGMETLLPPFRASLGITLAAFWSAAGSRW